MMKARRSRIVVRLSTVLDCRRCRREVIVASMEACIRVSLAKVCSVVGGVQSILTLVSGFLVADIPDIREATDAGKRVVSF